MPILLNLLYLSLLIFVSPFVLWRSWRHGRYRRGWNERIFGPNQNALSPCNVWLHAVSVGEIQVLRPIIETFELQRPELSLAISVSTDSGMDLANKLFPKHQVFFAPIDFTWAIRAAFRILKPDLIILAELELWPNWLMQAEKLGCPVAVINGRLGENSFRGYTRVRFLFRKCFLSLDWVGAQSETIAQRFQILGVQPKKITITGNVKFDGACWQRSAPEVIYRKNFLHLNSDHQVFLAGSTQSPEESLILGTFAKLANRYPTLKLIIVPRHVERFNDVAKQIEASGLEWTRQSMCPTDTPPDWRVFLADSVGELRWWWGLADIGFVGGSFGDRGGQNMIEPCAYGVATCFGPNTRNFADIVEILLETEACVQLSKPEDLQGWVESMLMHSTEREAMSTRAIQTCKRHRGATQRSWENLLQFLPEKEPTHFH
jgi:3-deoxy-D-manno-octulosonic-acid transferase